MRYRTILTLKSVWLIWMLFMFCALLIMISFIWTVLRKDMNVSISPLRNIPKAKVTRLKIHVAAGELLSWSDDQFLASASPFPELMRDLSFSFCNAHCILLVLMRHFRLAPESGDSSFGKWSAGCFLTSFLADLRRGRLTSKATVLTLDVCIPRTYVALMILFKTIYTFIYFLIQVPRINRLMLLQYLASLMYRWWSALFRRI